MAVIPHLQNGSGPVERAASKASAAPLTAAPPPPPSLLTRLMACLQYGFVSVAITLFNRAVFSVYAFNFPSLVTLLQVLVSLVFMYALRAAGHMQFGAISLHSARKAAPLAFFWWLYVVSGVTALRHLNVPMFSVIRRSTTLFVVSGEFWLFNKRPSHRSLAALLLMVGGAVVAGLTDLTYSPAGYAWVSLCVVSTAAYLLLIRKLQETTGMSQSTLLLYNNLLALPLMCSFLVTATTELRDVTRYPKLLDPGFIVFLLLSCSQAFLLNLCIFRCTLINSPLATNVTGQMKDILTTALGMVIFGDVRYSALNVGGILLGLLGSIGYSAVSYVESKASKQASFKEREPPLSPPGPRAAASRVSSGRLARAESARSEGRGEAR
ncbi:hypothetical protein ABPG77_007726 [Micractinium sp. CCAP 211/92]